MNIPKLYANGGFSLSFEVFPPKSAQGMEPLVGAVGELCRYRPGFVSCTYGAGGSTREQTLEIVTNIRQRFAVAGTAHLTCVGSTVEDIRAFLTRATELGVENIMALRGDPPQGQDKFVAVAGGLQYANELVGLIKREFPHFGVGIAGYPETHQEAPSPQADLENLKRKADAGGDTVFTQLFYDNDDFFRFRDSANRLGVSIPIIPGLLPVLSLGQIARITSLCKARLPGGLLARLESFRDDPAGQVNVGVDHAVTQCEGLLAAGVPGIHFYVLNKSESTLRILDAVKGRLPAKDAVA